MARCCKRTGSIQIAWLAFLGSAAVLAVLIGLLFWDPERSPSADGNEPLVVYCAAGIKAPVEKVTREYQERYGVPIQLDYGGSQTLLAKLETAQGADLYLPADDSYIQIARDKNLTAEVLPLARMTAVLAVRRGNQKNLRSLDDLVTGDARLAQAMPDAAAVGKLTRDALRKNGRWEALKARTTVFQPTVTDVARDIKVGTVDAGIIWDATVKQMPDLEAVPIPELENVTAQISISVLRRCPRPAAALRFARYLAARDRGRIEFEREGFQPVDGDPWAETPELRLSAGAMLRPAIDKTIKAFEEREGVRVTRVYNGCGILVAEMKAGARPDAYFACDKSFMEQVHDLFVDAVDVSTNQLVILVPRDNPHDIKSLKDLGKPGLRVGIGHEKQCALGVLTQQTLKQGGFQSAVMKNVKVQTPTGDMLVNQLRTGSLDAVVAYLSNAAGADRELAAIKIDGIPCAVAVQPIAVARDTRYRYLTMRLLEALRSSESRERFVANGFQWQGP
jgi:molybdenum ABC transporter molybdate-binding protein